MKWETPAQAARSNREPTLTQSPIATERTCGMRSVRTTMPFGRTSLAKSASTFPMAPSLRGHGPRRGRAHLRLPAVPPARPSPRRPSGALSG